MSAMTTDDFTVNNPVCDAKPFVLLCLEGEGEWLCRPYCFSHSSRSFSRRSRSLNTEPVSCSSQIADGPLQWAYFIRILRAMARSSPSRSCEIKQKEWVGGGGWRTRALLFQQNFAHTCRLCSCCWIFTCAAFLSALAAGWTNKTRS